MLHLLAAQSPQVTAWPQRLALTALVVAVIALSCWGMWRSWHRRASQELPVLPAPEHFAADLQIRGRYLGTSPADNWMVRIAANGMGAPGNAYAGLAAEGILLTREGESDIFIGSGQLTGVKIGRGVAAQVAEKDGLVLWFWNAGDTALQSGFRPELPEDVVRLLHASQKFLIQEEA